jgi:hypothetical protein
LNRFLQADGATAKRHSGLGLGLALVWHLVDLHRGSVRAESPGEGLGPHSSSTFPWESRRVRGWPATTLRRFGLALPAALDSLRILVVDDDADSREPGPNYPRAAWCECRSRGFGARGASQFLMTKHTRSRIAWYLTSDA